MIASSRNPLQELEDLLVRCRPVVDLPVTSQGDELDDVDWVPAVDVDRTDEAYLIRVELPGVARDDVAVTVEDGILTVSGRKRAAPRRLGQGRQTRRECLYGHFKRVFSLPIASDAHAAQASLRDGLLLVSLPWKKSPANDIVTLEVK